MNDYLKLQVEIQSILQKFIGKNNTLANREAIHDEVYAVFFEYGVPNINFSIIGDFNTLSIKGIDGLSDIAIWNILTNRDSDQTSILINHDLLNQAIDTWGKEAQMQMVQEECLELALAIQKFNRIRGDKKQQYLDIIDEIADVRIVIEQAMKIFPLDLINDRIKYKLNRLKDRLNEGVQ